MLKIFLVIPIILFVVTGVTAVDWTQTFAQSINDHERETVTRRIFVNTKANVSLSPLVCLNFYSSSSLIIVSKSNSNTLLGFLSLPYRKSY